MDSSKTVYENLDESLQISMMLNDTVHALDETSYVMCILNFLFDSFQVVKDSVQ